MREKLFYYVLKPDLEQELTKEKEYNEGGRLNYAQNYVKPRQKRFDDYDQYLVNQNRLWSYATKFFNALIVKTYISKCATNLFTKSCCIAIKKKKTHQITNKLF